MNKLTNNKNLTIINFIIVFYFTLIFLLNYYKINFVLLGVIIELLTLPFLTAQIFFLIIGVKHVITNQKNLITIISIIALAICTIITFSSFF